MTRWISSLGGWFGIEGDCGPWTEGSLGRSARMSKRWIRRRRCLSPVMEARSGETGMRRMRRIKTSWENGGNGRDWICRRPRQRRGHPNQDGPRRTKKTCSPSCARRPSGGPRFQGRVYQDAVAQESPAPRQVGGARRIRATEISHLSSRQDDMAREFTMSSRTSSPRMRTCRRFPRRRARTSSWRWTRRRRGRRQRQGLPL